MQLGAALVVMVSIEWRLTLLVLAVLPLFVIPARRVGERLQGLTREGMELNARMNSRMTERFNVAGAMLVKLFGRYGEETDEFADKAKRVADIGVKQALVGRVFFVTLAFVGAVGVAIVYLVGGRLAITSPDCSPGNVVTFAGLVTMAYSPLSALTNARVEIMTALVSFDRVFEILDVRHPITDRAAFEYIRSYSPYDNVRAQAYPPILVMAGLTDPRVTYWEPAKWVARLRELKTDDNPLYLRTNMDAGHSGAAGRFDALKETAIELAFALKVVGLAEAAPAPRRQAEDASA